MENRTDEQISRIEDAPPSRVKNDSILPQEIAETGTSKSIVDIEPALVQNYFREKVRGVCS
jgi:hypothetical protein